MISQILFALIKRLGASQDSKMRKQHKRCLSFQDTVFDRWKRAENLGFGTGTSIYNSSSIYGEVQVGKNTWIGPNTILDGSAQLSIGSYCSISSGVQIYSHDTVDWAVSGGKAPFNYGPVFIGDSVYIGSQSIISSGVSIGAHSIIGANTFVNCDIPSHSIFVGSPAKKIGRVEINGGVVTRIYES